MYTIYDDGGDTEIFERPDGTRERNEFVFAGFGNFIHPYHKKQTKWAIEMLKWAGIDLHIQNVPTVDDIGADADKGHFEIGDLKLKAVPIKGGRRTLVLMQDTEMGRGWAVLLEMKSDFSLEIIAQDHRDTIRDQTLLDEEWLSKQGISLKRKTVKDLDKLK